MEIWEYKQVKVKETEDQKRIRLRYNKGRRAENRKDAPSKREQKRFAKNRKSFYITLSDGSQYQLIDHQDALEIRKVDFDPFVIIPYSSNSMRIKKENKLNYWQRKQEEAVDL